MTCNPKWPEITRNLRRHQTASDRPDMVARIFKLKLNQLLDEIINQNVLGKVKALVYTIEFQKRGEVNFNCFVYINWPA